MTFTLLALSIALVGAAIGATVLGAIIAEEWRTDP